MKLVHLINNNYQKFREKTTIQLYYHDKKILRKKLKKKCY